MKKDVDAFYERLSNKRMKRRRMISLLMVLSMFVTSGVSWSLHGVGLTMVNEAECGAEEHKHTDECYEKQLICGLEENEEHVHSDDCYENVLVCGKTEHIHDEECYIVGSLKDLKDPESNTEDEALPIVEINSASENDEETLESEYTVSEDDALAFEEEGVMDSPILLRGNTADILADTPSVKETSDNRADGIHINLFDYGPSSIDVGNNNLQRYFNNNEDWMSNYAQGVNAGRTNDDDILFFAYGTPHTNSYWYEYPEDSGDWYHYQEALRPEKNNYAGNYDMGASHDAFPGNRPVQGIVNRNLGGDGYPSVSSSGNSLIYLFEPVNVDSTKTVYEDVNKLLTKDSDGKYHYNSNENYAYYDTDTEANPDKEFTVYNDTFNLVNDDHHIATDINQQTNAQYNDGGNGYPMAIGFFPFNQYDETHKDPNFNAVLYDEDQEKAVSDPYYNHHFGMTMDANFALPEDGLYNNKHVVFDYSGDDDMWVYLDDMLILDVGGIHEPASGRVDFTDGYVWVQDDQLPTVMKDNPDFNLQNFLTDKGDGTPYEGFAFARCTQDETGQIYDENGIPWVYDEYTSPFSTSASTGQSGTIKAKKYRISDLIAAAKRDKGEPYDFNTDYWEIEKHNDHNVKIFYLERGGNYSNLAMEFNLPTLKPIRVEKKVDGGSNTTDDYKDEVYTFQLYKEHESGVYEPYEEPFELTNGGSMVFPKLDQNAHYYVKEIGIDSSVYSEVKVNNNSPQILNPDSGIYDIDSTQDLLSENGVFQFTNTIREELIDLNVEKQWIDNNVNHSNDMIRFNIIRTDELGNESIIVYNNKKTFALKDGNNWHLDFSDLPVRYGTHTYSYRVKELDVPMHYAVEYKNTLENGEQTSLIQNKSTSNVEMHVKKDWLDNDGTPLENTSDFTIEVELHRKWVEYGDPNPTTLLIRAVDTKGRTLKEWYTSKAYVGGSIEYSVTPPEDSDVTFVGFDDEETTGCTVIESDGVCSVDINAANPVITMVYQEKEAPLYTILHHSFTQSTNGWRKRGNRDTSIQTNGAITYALNDALLVTGRTQTWHGAEYSLDLNTFIPGYSYSFGVYVYNDSDEAHTFKLTLQHDNSDIDGGYTEIASDTIPPRKWVKLENSEFIMPNEITTASVYVECDDAEANFRMDEFVAAKGGVHADVIEGTGDVVLTGEAVVEPIQHVDFNGSRGEWGPRDVGEDDLSYVSDPTFNGQSIKITNRDREGNTNATWRGICMPLPTQTYAPGSRFSFTTYAMCQDAMEFKLTIQYNDSSGNTHYKTVDQRNGEAGEWVQLSNPRFQIPSDAASDMILYVEAVSSTADFYVDEFVEAPVGYTASVDRNTGEVTLTYSSGVYNMTLDEDTSIAPRIVKQSGDEIFATFTLNNNDWTKAWSTADLQEIPDRTYEYYVKEIKVNGVPVDENGFAGDYKVSYSGNNVQTNSADNPITISNKYIWYKLPATGGIGVDLIYLMGILLTITGLIGGYALIMRERRSD